MVIEFRDIRIGKRVAFAALVAVLYVAAPNHPNTLCAKLTVPAL